MSWYKLSDGDYIARLKMFSNYCAVFFEDKSVENGSCTAKMESTFSQERGSRFSINYHL
jgi:hypothetical protein